MARVERQPAVDGPGHRHAADVPADRHDGRSLGAQGGGVGAGAGAAHCEQRLGWCAGGRHHGQHVTAEPAHVRPHDCHGGAGGHRGVGGRTVARQHLEPGRGCQLVGGGDHAAQPGARPERGEGQAQRRGVTG